MAEFLDGPPQPAHMEAVWLDEAEPFTLDDWIGYMRKMSPVERFNMIYANAFVGPRCESCGGPIDDLPHYTAANGTMAHVRCP